MNKQDTFDFIVRALVKQGRLSANPVTCLYRGPDGTKCAIGHLIPDELYDPNFDTCEDGLLITSGIEKDGFGNPRASNSDQRKLGPKLRSIIGARGKTNIEFLKNMQQAHDGAREEDFVHSFLQRARDVAQKYNLKTTVIEEVQ